MPYRPVGSEHTALSEVYTEKRVFSGANLTYWGWAQPGTGTDKANWAVQKRTYDGSNNLTNIQWADGNQEMDNIWDNYASLSYS